MMTNQIPQLADLIAELDGEADPTNVQSLLKQIESADKVLDSLEGKLTTN
jgi:hypothetical protein